MFQAPWMVIWPGLAVSISVFGINLLGDAVRDVLDPRLRTGVGKRKMKKIVKANRKKKG
jgi:peptide/nickel transport system permease protein